MDETGIKVNDRVRIKTDPSSIYFNKTGAVVKILNGHGTDLSQIPDGSLSKFPYWYVARFDVPAVNGPRIIQEDLFLEQELVKIKN